MLRNDSSAKEDICSPPDHSKPIVDAIVGEGGKREDDSGTGQKSISLSPAIAGSLPKSDQQANDQNDPSKPQVDAITVAQQIKGGGGKKDDENVVLVNSLPKSNQLADDQKMNVGEVGEDKLDNQKSGDEGRDMEEEKGSSGGKELDNLKMMGEEGKKADDDSGSNSNDEVTSQNSIREKDNSQQGFRHSREKLSKSNC